MIATNETLAHDRVSLFGIEIDRLRMPEAVARLNEWIHTTDGGTCRYVVTPNVDHVVMLRERADLRAVYAEASLVLADGMPVVLASRLLGRALPERVTGADLVPNLFEASTAERPLSVFLLGAMPGVGERAAANVEARWPHVSVTGVYSPPFGFEHDAAECEAILERIEDVTPDVLVVGLGAPKQELWVHAHRDRIPARIALCVGATIDFLAGEVSRAPEWMQRNGLEWLHRLTSEPGRLLGRYAKDAATFPAIVWDEMQSSRKR